VARSITPIPLAHADFKPFGDVIEAGNVKTRSINEGNTTRYYDLADLDLSAEGGRPGLNIFRSNPPPQPTILKIMERHPLSSQAFYPLGTSEDKKNKPTIPISSKVYTLFQVNQTVGAFVEF
jgi:ureidoglycolate lyase